MSLAVPVRSQMLKATGWYVLAVLVREASSHFFHTSAKKEL